VKRLLACALAVVLIGLLLPSLAQAATPVSGGVLTYALQSDPAGIEPLNPDYFTGGAQVCQALFWGLTRYQLQPDGTLATVPAVASSWDVNSDATVFTFHLRSGVTFSAPVSREVNALDFKYAWNRATDPANGLAASWFFSPIKGWSDSIGGAPNGLTGVKALDNYTLEVTLRHSFADLPTMLANPIAAPVPGEYIQSLGTTRAARNQAFSQQPVGDGPYMLKSWTHNQQIVLVRNPAFWDPANAGNVDEIDMPIYSDPTQEWTDFENGNLDFAAIPQGQVQAAITTYGQSLDGYTVAPGSQVLTGPADTVQFISFNCQKVPFKDNANLRRALSLAIDRQAVANLVSEGTATIASDILPPGIAGYQANAWAYSHYDKPAAAALLATAGDPGGAGLPSIIYSYDTSPLYAAIAQQLKTDLAAIGVNVTLEAVDSSSSYWSKLYGGDFMMARVGWVADHSCADDFLYYLFQSGQNQAFTSYSNAAVDTQLAAAQGTTDAGARLAAYQAVDAAIGLDAPVIPLYAPPNLGVGAARLSNAVLSPFGQFDFEGVWLTNGDQPVAAISSLTSPTNTVSSHWYVTDKPTFSWTGSPTLAAPRLAGARRGTPTVAGYSYLLDQNPFAFPPSTVMTTDTTFTAPPMADGVWYFHLRAQGDNGIWGPVKTYTARIDTHPPTTSAPKSSSVRRGAVATLAFKVSDAKPNGGWAAVTIKVKNAHGRIVKSLNVGKKSVNKVLSTRFICKLAKGTYRFAIYAKDAAGNGQSKIGSNKLVVK
jgi:ABC-type oligopeptide transport system substrate-binding subunit